MGCHDSINLGYFIYFNTHRHVLHDGDLHAAVDERARNQRRGHHEREVAERVEEFVGPLQLKIGGTVNPPRLGVLGPEQEEDAAEADRLWFVVNFGGRAVGDV